METEFPSGLKDMYDIESGAQLWAFRAPLFLVSFVGLFWRRDAEGTCLPCSKERSRPHGTLLYALGGRHALGGSITSDRQKSTQ